MRKLLSGLVAAMFVALLGAAQPASAAPSPAPSASAPAKAAVAPWKPDPQPTVDPAVMAVWLVKLAVGSSLAPNCDAHGGLADGSNSIKIPSLDKPYPAQLLCRDGKTIRVDAPGKVTPL